MDALILQPYLDRLVEAFPNELRHEVQLELRNERGPKAWAIIGTGYYSGDTVESAVDLAIAEHKPETPEQIERKRVAKEMRDRAEQIEKGIYTLERANRTPEDELTP